MGRRKLRNKRAKFYVDECVPDWVMVHLWARGYNARLTKDDVGSHTDDSILLRQAKRQGRVFVTLDKGRDIKLASRGKRHPGVIVVAGDSLNESYVCAALDTLLQWGARHREDYENLYIKISEGQLSIEMEDGNILVIGSDGSLVLREVNGSMIHDRKAIEEYVNA